MIPDDFVTARRAALAAAPHWQCPKCEARYASVGCPVCDAIVEAMAGPVEELPPPSGWRERPGML